MSQGNDEKRPEDANPELPVFRPDKSGLEQALGALEAQVMEAVWDGGGDVCVDDVRRALGPMARMRPTPR